MGVRRSNGSEVDLNRHDRNGGLRTSQELEVERAGILPSLYLFRPGAAWDTDADERDGNRLRADAVARDATSGGVGGVEGDGERNR